MPCIVQVEAKLPIGTYITYLLTYLSAVSFAAVKEFILKLICRESSQNHGHWRHDFQLKMHQKTFSSRAPPGPAGGA